MSDEPHHVMSRAQIDLLAKLETRERSEVWVYVTFDEDDPERPVNATGFFPDEHQAFLAGQEYQRTWAADIPEDVGVVTKPIPLFIERGQIDAD